MVDNINWQVGNYEQLEKQDIYAMFELRVAVFVVEQQCAYNEIDGQDQLATTIHYLAYSDEQLCCYARLLAPAAGSDMVRIGRVVVSPDYRRLGLATKLMDKMIKDVSRVEPRRGIALSAQVEAMSLYKNLGFKSISAEYLDDGIPHIDMQLVPGQP